LVALGALHAVEAIWSLCCIKIIGSGAGSEASKIKKNIKPSLFLTGYKTEFRPRVIYNVHALVVRDRGRAAAVFSICRACGICTRVCGQGRPEITRK